MYFGNCNIIISESRKQCLGGGRKLAKHDPKFHCTRRHCCRALLTTISTASRGRSRPSSSFARSATIKTRMAATPSTEQSAARPPPSGPPLTATGEYGRSNNGKKYIYYIATEIFISITRLKWPMAQSAQIQSRNFSTATPSLTNNDPSSAVERPMQAP